jgi:O-acetyl-ADP-ribose deacetylase
MIRVVQAGPGQVRSEAILRSMTSELAADTGFSREVELAAGEEVSRRLQAMGELPVGAAVITPGGDHPASFLIHVVLRSREDPVGAEAVRTGLKNGLRRARELGLESLGLPPLGTGAGNLDPQESAAVMVPVLLDHHRSSSAHPRNVTLLVATPYEEEVFLRALDPAAGGGETQQVRDLGPAAGGGETQQVRDLGPAADGGETQQVRDLGPAADGEEPHEVRNPGAAQGGLPLSHA